MISDFEAQDNFIPTLHDVQHYNDVPRLHRLFGCQAVFVPVQLGTKKPMRKVWQYAGNDVNRDGQWNEDLRRNNVAVLLGEPSCNIVCVDFDDGEFQRAFAMANHELYCKTLQSKGARGCHVWFKMDGEYPRSVQRITNSSGDHVGEFRGGKALATIAGVHPSNCEHKIENEVFPCVVAFSEIKWPEGYEYPWMRTPDAEIAERVGPPFDAGKGKASRLNAAFFAEWVLLNSRIVFEETEGSFYLYSEQTGEWRKTSDLQMAKHAAEVSFGFVDRQDPSLIDSIKLLFTQAFRRDIVTILRCEVAVSGFFGEGSHRNARHLIIHCLDGMIRFLPQTGSGAKGWIARPFSPVYRSRQCFPCRLIDDSQCPQFEGLLKFLFGEENLADAWKFLGYLLIEGNPANHILVLKGKGGGGKSQLVKVLNAIFPADSWGQLRTSQLDGRFELAGFATKRLVSGPDVSKDFLSTEGARNLKPLTGGDFMEAEVKFSNTRTAIVGDKHVLISTNNVLRLAAGEDATAWKRRLILIEAKDNDPETKVLSIADLILAAERDAVFSRLVEAAYEASVELHGDGELQIPDRFRLGTSGVALLQGCVTQWVTESVEEGETCFATQDLFTIYSRWCAVRGEEPVSESVFAKRLKRLMEERGHASAHNVKNHGSETQRNGYRGLAVKA